MLYHIYQAAPSAPSPTQGIISQFVLLGGIFLIFWLLLIRPQNQRAKAHRQKLSEIVRGDTIITGGGVIGKVTKATDEELTIDVGNNVKMKVMRAMVADVRGKPAPANDTKPAKKAK